MSFFMPLPKPGKKIQEKTYDFFEKYKQRMAEKPSLEEEFQSLTIETENLVLQKKMNHEKNFF